MLAVALVALFLVPILILVFDLFRTGNRRVKGLSEPPQDGGWASPGEVGQD